eukprot:2956234-Amphidinium_carterae.1
MFPRGIAPKYFLLSYGARLLPCCSKVAACSRDALASTWATCKVQHVLNNVTVTQLLNSRSASPRGVSSIGRYGSGDGRFSAN